MLLVKFSSFRAYGNCMHSSLIPAMPSCCIIFGHHCDLSSFRPSSFPCCRRINLFIISGFRFLHPHLHHVAFAHHRTHHFLISFHHHHGVSVSITSFYAHELRHQFVVVHEWLKTLCLFRFLHPRASRRQLAGYSLSLKVAANGIEHYFFHHHYFE